MHGNDSEPDRLYIVSTNRPPAYSWFPHNLSTSSTFVAHLSRVSLDFTPLSTLSIPISMTPTTHNAETPYANLDFLARFSIHTKPRNSQFIDRPPILVSPCIVFPCIYSFCLSFCILCIITATSFSSMYIPARCISLHASCLSTFSVIPQLEVLRDFEWSKAQRPSTLSEVALVEATTGDSCKHSGHPSAYGERRENAHPGLSSLYSRYDSSGSWSRELDHAKWLAFLNP